MPPIGHFHVAKIGHYHVGATEAGKQVGIFAIDFDLWPGIYFPEK
jgi:hypothetical protein